MSRSDDRVAVDTAPYWPEDSEEDEGVVVNWFVREGAHVDADQTLCEIQIEKVDIDVLAPVGGELVEVVYGEDDAFDRGDTLAWIAPD